MPYLHNSYCQRFELNVGGEQGGVRGKKQRLSHLHLNANEFPAISRQWFDVRRERGEGEAIKRALGTRVRKRTGQGQWRQFH